MNSLNFLEAVADGVSDNFAAPIEVFHEDHARQIKLCKVLEDMVEDIASGNEPALVYSAMSFFQDELPRHILDEEQGLFPILERHIREDKQIENVIRQLRKEHEFDDDLVSFILADLEVLARGKSLPNPTRLVINIRAFSEGLRRHSGWEQAVVLPLAGKYLSEAELRELSRNMAARRLAPK